MTYKQVSTGVSPSTLKEGMDILNANNQAVVGRVGVYQLSANIVSNNLVITLLNHSGTDISTTEFVDFTFRNSTLTNGTNTDVRATSPVSITIPATSTLGHSSLTQLPVNVYALNNNGTIVLAVSGVNYSFVEGNLHNTSNLISAPVTANNVLATSGVALSNVAGIFIGQIVAQNAGPNWSNVTVIRQRTAQVREPFSVSANIVPAAAALRTFTHGLGQIPTNINYFLIMQSAVAGYSVGDIVHTLDNPFVCNINSVDINIRFVSTATFNILHKTTGVATSINLTDFNLQVVARR